MIQGQGKQLGEKFKDRGEHEEVMVGALEKWKTTARYSNLLKMLLYHRIPACWD